jgi:hypothetical protein
MYSLISSSVICNVGHAQSACVRGHRGDKTWEWNIWYVIIRTRSGSASPSWKNSLASVESGLGSRMFLTQFARPTRKQNRTPRMRTFISFSDAKKLQWANASVWYRRRGGGIHPYLGSMIGLSYMLDDVIATVPELSGFKTTGLCTANA